ncbi:MAG: hypothetical protein OIF56_04580, partial [Cohaesibacter sp.]|nr:hypothetical protein [Cohaesibacter sp.]
NYIIYKARVAEKIDKAGLKEDGISFDPSSLFLLSQNHFSGDFTLLEVIDFIKEEFSDVKIAGLYD